VLGTTSFILSITILQLIRLTRRENQQTILAYKQKINLLNNKIRELDNRVNDGTNILTHNSEYLELVSTISGDISSTGTSDDLKNMIVSQIKHQLGYDFVGLFIVDDNKQALYFMDDTSESGAMTIHKEYPSNMTFKTIHMRVLKEEKPYIVNDYDIEEKYVRFPELSNISSELALPLKIRDEVLGVLSVGFGHPHNFTLLDTKYLQILANQIALAIDNDRLSHDSLQDVDALYGAMQAVVSANTPEEVLSGFVSNLLPSGVDQCLLLVKVDGLTTDVGAKARVEAIWEEGTFSSISKSKDSMWDLIHVLPE
jgi:transcriptional regulator with GAF, ATPase, and Fis domain